MLRMPYFIIMLLKVGINYCQCLSDSVHHVLTLKRPRRVGNGTLRQRHPSALPRDGHYGCAYTGNMITTVVLIIANVLHRLQIMYTSIFEEGYCLSVLYFVLDIFTIILDIHAYVLSTNTELRYCSSFCILMI